MKNLRTYGENKTTDRVEHAESHGAHGKVTALKKRRVIAKKRKNIKYIYIYIYTYIFINIYTYTYTYIEEI